MKPNVFLKEGVNGKPPALCHYGKQRKLAQHKCVESFTHPGSRGSSKASPGKCQSSLHQSYECLCPKLESIGTNSTRREAALLFLPETTHPVL